MKIKINPCKTALQAVLQGFMMEAPIRLQLMSRGFADLFNISRKQAYRAILQRFI